MAAVGSAVGLGNFWRFPYEAGAQGGAAFVVVYLIAVGFIAYPVLMSEYAIGQRTGRSAVGATGSFAQQSGRSRAWGVVGWIGMIAGFLILSFYAVIAGWVMAYVPTFLSGAITPETDFEQASALFGALTGDPTRVVIWQTIFMVITTIVVARGLRGGIEVAANVLMPAFFIMLAAMVIYALIVGNAADALAFLFTPDFSKITPNVIVSAIGQAFFSVGVGSAIMITYGAYLSQNTRIPGAARTVAGCDTLVAMLAGLAIFPLVFATEGLEPNAGPGLLFVTLPAAISQLPGASIVGAAFFTLAFFAALTSAISLFEVVVSYGEEKVGTHLRWPVAIVAGFLVWFVGLGSALSTNVLSGFHPVPFGPFTGQTIFDTLDILTGQLLLPISGLMLAIYSGWVLNQQALREELTLSPGAFALYQGLIRFVIPLAIGGVLVAANWPS